MFLDFTKNLLYKIFEFENRQQNKLTISCYNYNKDNQHLSYVGSIKDIEILTLNDIEFLIKNCYTETKLLTQSLNHKQLITLYKINISGKTNTSLCLVNLENILPSVTLIKNIMNSMNLNNNISSNGGNSWLEEDLQLTDVNVIGCIDQNKSSENIITSLCKIWLPKKNDTEEEEYTIEVENENKQSNQTTIKLSETNTINQNELQDVDIPNIILTNSASEIDNVNLSSLPVANSVPTLSPNNPQEYEERLHNEIMKLKKEKNQLEQIVRVLQNSLKLERAEKLMLVNENTQLREQIVSMNKKK